MQLNQQLMEEVYALAKSFENNKEYSRIVIIINSFEKLTNAFKFLIHNSVKGNLLADEYQCEDDDVMVDYSMSSIYRWSLFSYKNLRGHNF